MSEYYITRGGVRCAGVHILLDMWGVDAELLKDEARLRSVMESAADVAKATRLYEYFHKFHEAGVTGAVMLKESHITVHTWPETGFAAFDVFLCGKTRPDACVQHIVDHMKPALHKVTEELRGRSRQLRVQNKRRRQ